MRIKKISISNFKVFRHVELNMQKYNVLIGANASGKSSFVEIFKFIYNLSKEGLKNAVSMTGGIEYLRNINLGHSEPLVLSFTLGGFPQKRRQEVCNGDIFFRQTKEISYQLKLDFNSEKTEYEIIEDKLKVDLVLYKEKQSISEESAGEISLELFRKNDRPELKIYKKQLSFSADLLTKEMILPSFFNDYKLSERETILESPLAFVIEPGLKEIMQGISLYNINPSLSRQIVPASGKNQLEEEGGNLALVLRNILSDEEKKRKFLNLINDVLPFIETMDVEKYADKSLLLKLKENYMEQNYIPSALFSDGTINITALIVALYFENNSIVVIEEPERNIHPHLISRLVEMIKEVAEKRQVIVTTHNPELIKFIDLENLYLVHRNNNGFAKIDRPVEKKEVEAFLDNDMGIDDLYIQNLLEV